MANGGGRLGQGPYHGLHHQPSLLHPAAAGRIPRFAEGADIARASWAFPLVGAGVGAARRAGLLARRRARARIPSSRGMLRRGRHDARHRLPARGRPRRHGRRLRRGGKPASASSTSCATARSAPTAPAALTLSLMLRAGAIASLAEPGLVASALDSPRMPAPRRAAGLHAARAAGAPRRTLGAMPGRRRRTARSSPRCSACVALLHRPRLWRRADRRRAARGRDASSSAGSASGRSADRPATCSARVEQVSEILILLVAAAWL